MCTFKLSATICKKAVVSILEDVLAGDNLGLKMATVNGSHIANGIQQVREVKEL